MMDMRIFHWLQQKKDYYKSLGESQQELLKKMGETRLFSQGEKLIQSLSRKKNYTVHYITLSFTLALAWKSRKYIRSGVEVQTNEMTETLYETEYLKERRISKQVRREFLKTHEQFLLR